ncbi:hypothetical protein Kpho02_51510 [Kitasatospora phosalacinea]|uniref:Uncharacterized protein n=1 Tax=Kitasatospora phosalacinea TaxID=2065 RepID=A0A9W6QE42_9ACTN|nr:hypothetical protein [Kitasatospora phosalacinea]GLW72852.1 hypothetical protein Kpho02_51510 [Kitasatospora phosalacinea]
MVLLCLGVVAGYALGGLLTARTVFRRERERFLRAGGARAVADERRVGTFERQERQQTEAFALCAGALWPVALPVLALHGLVGAVALDRGRVAVVRPDPREVAARIEELERELELGPHAGPAPRPTERRQTERRPAEPQPVEPRPVEVRPIGGRGARGGTPSGLSRCPEQRTGAAPSRYPRSA